MISLNKIIIFFLIFLVTGCADYNNQITIKKHEKKFYSSLGFALIFSDQIYEDRIVNRKMKNTEFGVMHSSLKKNTHIKVINPDNSKFVNAKVINNAMYPKIFNAVISKKIAELLDLDINNPYIEIVELKKNKKFIAKEVDIFDEEKKVAGTVQINEITIDDVSIDKSVDIKDKDSKKNSDFIIVISDFYYADSAKNLKKHLINSTKDKNFFIKKIEDNKYRLSAGPFRNFNALKTTYISLNNLGFEDLNIYRK